MTTSNQPKSAVRPLRILMQNRAATFSARGGDTVVLERLRDGLLDRGCQVTIDVTGKENPRAFDIVHLFNFATPDITRQRAEAAVAANVPFVVTTLYEDVPEFHNQSHAVAARAKEYVNRQQDKLFWQRYQINLSQVPKAPRFDNEYVAAKAAALFANGEGERQALERDYPYAKSLIKVVTLGHEVGPRVTAEAFERAHGVKDFVLCVGRFESRKNQLMLLKALEHSDLTVVLAGGGFSYQPDYTQAVRSFKRRGQTIILERVSPEMLASAYAACRVHALPSWFELPGLVSLEAASYGKNVVATRTGTTADYLGDSAFYCLPWDEQSIETAVMAGYYAPPKAGLQEIAERFTWASTADATLAEYERIVGVSASPVMYVPMSSAAEDSSGREEVEVPDTLERGELAAKQGDFDLSLELLAKAEKISPTSPRVLKALGAVHLAKANAAEAQSYFEQAMRYQPNDTKILAGRGMCEVLQGKYAEAMPYFERAVQADPVHLVAIHQLLRCAYAVERFESAEKALGAFLVEKPEDSSMRFCLAGCLYKLGKLQAAREEVQKVLAAQPDDASAAQLKALIDKACAEAVIAESANEVSESPRPVTSSAAQVEFTTATAQELNDSLSELSRQIAEWKLGTDTSSTKMTEAVVAASPVAPPPAQSGQPRMNPLTPQQSHVVGENAGSGYIESKICEVEDLKRDRKIKEAIEAFEALPTAVGMTPQQNRRVRCLSAEFEVLDGNLTKADRLYTEILAEDPKNARALCGKGALAAEAQNWTDARQYFDSALEAKPGYDVALAGLGLCEMVGNKGETAFDYFCKAVRSNPENQRALFGVLQVGYPLQRYQEIEELLTQYLDIHPASVDMLYSFAGVLFAQGKMQQARFEVEKILLFEPANSRALELIKMIETGKQAGSATVTTN